MSHKRRRLCHTKIIVMKNEQISIKFINEKHTFGFNIKLAFFCILFSSKLKISSFFTSRFLFLFSKYFFISTMLSNRGDLYNHFQILLLLYFLLSLKSLVHLLVKKNKIIIIIICTNENKGLENSFLNIIFHIESKSMKNKFVYHS